jgi:hypothetical protein
MSNRYLNNPEYVLYFSVDEEKNLFYIYPNDKDGLEAAEKELYKRGMDLLTQNNPDEAYKLAIDAVPFSQLSTPSDRRRKNITDVGELKEKIPKLKQAVYDNCSKNNNNHNNN